MGNRKDDTKDTMPTPPAAADTQAPATPAGGAVPAAKFDEAVDADQAAKSPVGQGSNGLGDVAGKSDDMPVPPMPVARQKTKVQVDVKDSGVEEFNKAIAEHGRAIAQNTPTPGSPVVTADGMEKEFILAQQAKVAGQGGGLKVVALRPGYYGQRRIVEGEVFEIRDESELGDWMKTI